MTGRSAGSDALLGCVGVVLANILFVVLCFVAASVLGRIWSQTLVATWLRVLLVGLGLIQWLWVGPMISRARRPGNEGLVRGLVLGAVATLLMAVIGFPACDYMLGSW
jgi:hypothetical protein